MLFHFQKTGANISETRRMRKAYPYAPLYFRTLTVLTISVRESVS